jgi:rare lipoprotein A
MLASGSLTDRRFLSRRFLRIVVGLAIPPIACVAGLASADPLIGRASEQSVRERAQQRPRTTVGRGRAAVSGTSIGLASFIAASLEGKKTASGERYDGSAMVAAHRTYPLGTRLRVTNLANGRTVVVRVIDRMGPRRGRRSAVLDLSRAAAERLAFVREGTAKVKMEVIR